MPKRLLGVPLADEKSQANISPAVARGRAVQALAEAGRPGAFHYHEPPDTLEIGVESDGALDHSSSDTSDVEMPAAEPSAHSRPDEGYTRARTPVCHPESQPTEDWDEDLTSGSSRDPLPGLSRAAHAPNRRRIGAWPRARHGYWLGPPRPGQQRTQPDAPATASHGSQEGKNTT